MVVFAKVAAAAAANSTEHDQAALPAPAGGRSGTARQLLLPPPLLLLLLRLLLPAPNHPTNQGLQPHLCLQVVVAAPRLIDSHVAAAAAASPTGQHHVFLTCACMWS
jgi:hypothetical protein